jgi:hypothetical protein
VVVVGLFLIGEARRDERQGQGDEQTRFIVELRAIGEFK